MADLKLKLNAAVHSAVALVDRRLILILSFGVANGLLYACLLPLWDGFDEPFHYAYLTSLSADHELPALGQTGISQEVEQSFTLTPLPYVLHRAVAGSRSFDEWMALPETERFGRRNALAVLPRGLRRELSGRPNYEAQQAPLAYFLLAPLDAILSRAPLPARVLIIRLTISVVSTLLLAWASLTLFRALELERLFQNVALFCLLATPMTWAAIAHVGNDWLAIPTASAFLAALVILVKESGPRPALWLAVFLTAGLLTKAYFLAFIPIFLAALFAEVLHKKLALASALRVAAMPLFVAGPWYLRNLILYGSASGTQESVSGITTMRTLSAFPHINWITSFVRLARSSIWTGNWSYISFPRAPLNAELIMATVALAILFAGRRKLALAEHWVLATCTVFLLAMAYQLAAMWAFTGGSSGEAEPWYLQCIAPGFLSLVALGLQRGTLTGRVLAMLLAITAAGISAFSYLGVLFPWYGGFRGGGAARTLGWWLDGNPFLALSTVALVPAPWLFWVSIVFIGLLIAAAAMVIVQSAGRRLK